MKKSFILHIDSLDVLEELTDEQAGQLLKAMLEYHKTGKTSLTGVMSAIFISFKNQFIRDEEKYQKICERNKNNGLTGGRPKPQDNTKETPKEPKRTQWDNLGLSGIPKEPKLTQANPKEPDSDSDSKNDNDKDNPDWFDGHVIRLKKKDYMDWLAMTGWSDDYFNKVLSERDDWLASEPAKAKNWFMSTSKFLQNSAKQN